MRQENIKGKHQQFEGELHNDMTAEVLLPSIHTHTPFASLIDLNLNVDTGMAETGSWHCMSGGFDTCQLPDKVLPHTHHLR